MKTSRSGSGPGKGTDSWATESVPMAVRRQLLERELRSVAARNGKARAISPPDDSPHDGHTGHPQADAPDEEHAA